MDKPRDYKPNDGWWAFNSKKLYLMDGSMMNRGWLIVTELMRRRKDLKDEFLIPFRRSMEKTLSIPEQIVKDADIEAKEKSFEQQMNDIGVRCLKDGEDIKRK